MRILDCLLSENTYLVAGLNVTILCIIQLIFMGIFFRVIRGASMVQWFPNLTGTINLESL